MDVDDVVLAFVPASALLPTLRPKAVETAALDRSDKLLHVPNLPRFRWRAVGNMSAAARRRETVDVQVGYDGTTLHFTLKM